MNEGRGTKRPAEPDWTDRSRPCKRKRELPHGQADWCAPDTLRSFSVPRNKPGDARRIASPPSASLFGTHVRDLSAAAVTPDPSRLISSPHQMHLASRVIKTMSNCSGRLRSDSNVHPERCSHRSDTILQERIDTMSPNSVASLGQSGTIITHDENSTSDIVMSKHTKELITNGHGNRSHSPNVVNGTKHRCKSVWKVSQTRSRYNVAVVVMSIVFAIAWSWAVLRRSPYKTDTGADTLARERFQGDSLVLRNDLKAFQLLEGEARMDLHRSQSNVRPIQSENHKALTKLNHSLATIQSIHKNVDNAEEDLRGSQSDKRLQLELDTTRLTRASVQDDYHRAREQIEKVDEDLKWPQYTLLESSHNQANLTIADTVATPIESELMEVIRNLQQQLLNKTKISLDTFQDLEVANGDLTRLKSDSLRLRDELESFQSLASQARSDLQQSHFDVELMRSDKEGVVSKLNHSLALIQVMREELDNANDELRASNEEKSQIHNSLKVLQVELETTRSTLASLQNDYRRTRKQLKQAETDLSASQVELMESRRNFENAQAHVIRSETVATQIEMELKGEIGDLREELINKTLALLETRQEAKVVSSELAMTRRELQNVLWHLTRAHSDVQELQGVVKYQEEVAAHTINFVTTMAINVQQEKAAHVVNFMTTFATNHQRGKKNFSGPGENGM